MPTSTSKTPATEVADDLDALQRVHVAVQVAHAHAHLGEVFGELLGHALGQHGDQRAEALGRDGLHLGQQVVHLALDWADVDEGIHEAGRADDLLGEDAGGALHLPGAGRGADEDGLGAEALPLLELQRAVVGAARQAEAEIAEDDLPRVVAPVHAADLRHGDMALVHDQQRAFGQVFEERRRRLAGVTAGEVAGIVLDAFAGAGGLHHLDVEGGALVEALGLQQLALGLQLLQALLQLDLDVGRWPAGASAAASRSGCWRRSRPCRTRR
jgi:hypothetical protein